MLENLIINLADVILVVILILFAICGWKSGFLKMGFGLVSFIVAILLGKMIYPHCSAFLRSTPVYTSIRSLAEKNALQHTPETTEGFFAEFFAKSGELVAEYIAEIALNVLAFLLVVILVKLLLFLISKLLKLFSTLPVIGLLNRISGLLIGVIEGLLLVTIALALVYLISPLRESPYIEHEIEKSVIVHQMYYENPIIQLIKPSP